MLLLICPEVPSASNDTVSMRTGRPRRMPRKTREFFLAVWGLPCFQVSCRSHVRLSLKNTKCLTLISRLRITVVIPIETNAKRRKFTIRFWLKPYALNFVRVRNCPLPHSGINDPYDQRWHIDEQDVDYSTNEKLKYPMAMGSLYVILVSTMNTEQCWYVTLHRTSTYWRAPRSCCCLLTSCFVLLSSALLSVRLLSERSRRPSAASVAGAACRESSW